MFRRGSFEIRAQEALKTGKGVLDLYPRYLGKHNLATRFAFQVFEFVPRAIPLE
jgi:hypothetical protein